MDNQEGHPIDEDQIVCPEEPNVYEQYYKMPDVYRFPFDKQGMEKPWNENRGEKMEDYFNYGMYLISTWREY